MRRHFRVYLVLAVVEPALFGQGSAQIENRQPATTQQQSPGQPRMNRYRGADTQAPAARYSPLAAQGGYSHAHTSPLEAAVHALNPGPRRPNLSALHQR